MSAPERRPVFLSPHYDDAALSCGGTLAGLASRGDCPLVLTVFGGEPPGPLSRFAEEMHRLWRLDPAEAIAHRRQEEACAAEALGVEAAWLDLPDAIYRGERYTCDEHLFGAVHPEEAMFHRDIRNAVFGYLNEHRVEPDTFYCPLAIGNHVDHQLVLATARSLTYRGHSVIAWEDYPYAGDPGVEVEPLATRRTCGQPEINQLDDHDLTRKIEAINCYASQNDIIFRFQGDPVTATRFYAERVGNGAPAERFWPLGHSR